MKRFFGALICIITFAACDDGDLIVDTINFDEIPTSSCPDNNLLFKLKEGESLILNVPEGTFLEKPTVKGDPIILDVDPTNQVVYNFYDGKVSTATICNLIPPANPTIKNQWNASSGKIEIITETVKTADETNNSTKITGYKNSIVFTNVTFAKGDGTTQFYKTFPFGEYIKNINPLALAFNQILDICETNGLVYGFNDTESLTLAIDKSLIVNKVTPLDKPRIGTIGLEKNKLVYHSYATLVQKDYFCKNPVPVLPAIKEEWFGKEGGVIEVTTTTNGPNSFIHVITLKNVTLERENRNFQLGNNYLYGTLELLK